MSFIGKVKKTDEIRGQTGRSPRDKKKGRPSRPP
jgi:hypothetical protein